MRTYRLLIFSNPPPGRADEFFRYYEDHLPEAVQMQECFEVQQFRSVETNDPSIRSPYQHLVVAEWHADDVETSWNEHIRVERAEQERDPAQFADAVAAGVMKEQVDEFDNPHWFFEPIGPPITKPRVELEPDAGD